MQHLELEEAVDFVRGILSKVQEDSISEHLTSCTRCHAVARWATAVAATARDAQRLDPPSDVVRKAIAIFSEAAERYAPLSVRLARVVHDSRSDPLPSREPAGHVAARRMLYRAGKHSIDLRIEYDAEEDRVLLVGQITDHAYDTGRGKAASSVLLADDRRIIAHSPVSELGEFQLEYSPRPRLRLRIPLDRENAGIEVPLARVRATAEHNVRGQR